MITARLLEVGKKSQSDTFQEKRIKGSFNCMVLPGKHNAMSANRLSEKSLFRPAPYNSTKAAI